MEQGWGKPQVDRSIREKPLSWAGGTLPMASEPMQRVSSGSTWPRGADRFLATVGVDDTRRPGGGVIFKISGDGKALFESDIMKVGQPPKTVDIDLKGVKTLVLAVDAVGDNSN